MERIYITDVAPRDGLQNQSVAVSTEDKFTLISKLVDAGIENAEVTSFVSPKAVPMMSDAAELFPKVQNAFPQLNSFVLVPNLKGLEKAHEAGVKEVAFVLCATEMMNQKNINMSLAQAIESTLQLIEESKRLNIRSRTYISVAFDCPYEGETPLPRIVELAKKVYEAGTDQIVIADTIGSAAPAQVTERLNEILKYIPVEKTVIHLHDTRGMAVANAWAALQCGIRWFDASVGGIGGCPFAPGAAGNMATEDLVLMAEQSGFDTGISLEKLLYAVDHAQQVLDKTLGGGSIKWLRQNVKATTTLNPKTLNF